MIQTHPEIFKSLSWFGLCVGYESVSQDFFFYIIYRDILTKNIRILHTRLYSIIVGYFQRVCRLHFYFFPARVQVRTHAPVKMNNIIANASYTHCNQPYLHYHPLIPCPLHLETYWNFKISNRYWIIISTYGTILCSDCHACIETRKCYTHYTLPVWL